MNITVLCSSLNHPVNIWLKSWIEKQSISNEVDMIRSAQELKGGDILFLISCSEIITKKQRNLYRNTLIIHASDLPEGRGWSPHIWQIIGGTSEVIISLIEAEDNVDSGDIWKKANIQILKTDLYDDINKKLFDAEMELMDFAVNNIEDVKPSKQDLSAKPTYHAKRTPNDSELNINKSLKENFNLIRVCDPSRFPAFFYYEGMKYQLYIEKDGDK